LLASLPRELFTLTPQPFNPQFCSSLSCTQEGGDNPRIATPVEYAHDKEGFFIRGVGNQKIPNELKT